MLKNAKRFPWVTHPGSSVTPPNDPLNAYAFSSVANIGVDDESAENLTLTGTGAVIVANNGNASQWTGSSSFLSRSALLTDSFSACGWIRGSTLDTLSNFVPFKAYQDADHYIEISLYDNTVTDGVHNISCTWQDSGNSNTFNFTVPDDSWIFWGVVAEMGVGIDVRINNQTQSQSTANLNISGNMDLRVNQDSSYGGSETFYLDELYLWETDLLTINELGWLYNNGTGRYYPW